MLFQDQHGPQGLPLSLSPLPCPWLLDLAWPTSASPFLSQRPPPFTLVMPSSETVPCWNPRGGECFLSSVRELGLKFRLWVLAGLLHGRTRALLLSESPVSGLEAWQVGSLAELSEYQLRATDHEAWGFACPGPETLRTSEIGRSRASSPILFRLG